MSEHKEQKSVFLRFGKTKAPLFVLLAALAALMLLLLPSSSGSPDTDKKPAAEESLTEYCAMLESKAEELICLLDGVKECCVVVTLETGYTCTYATDQSVKESFFESGSTSQKETQKTVVFHDSDGSAVVLKQELPRISGVGVVCRGATRETQYKIISLVSALFDVSSNRINVQI